MTGQSLKYLTIFFNSNFFRFCYKDYFPELLGESRELRKVFFETIKVKSVKDEDWYEKKLEQIIHQKRKGWTTEILQNEVEERLFNLYELSMQERNLIRSESHSAVY